MSRPADPCLQDRAKVRKIDPGAYVCPENHLHFFAVEICEHLGVEPTPENLDQVTEEYRKAIGEKWPQMRQDVKE